MRASYPLLLCVLLLCSCSTPPNPPTVDESRKRPVNAASAIELQTCKSDLQNTRILASETTRLAESASATATRLALHQQQMSSQQVTEANAVYTVRFAYGGSQVVVPSSDAPALIERARGAALVMLRGRTDGEADNPAESRVAHARAWAVRNYFVHSGVDPNRIRTTWQSVGDGTASNDTASGRSQNRRVEIELYRQAPQAFAVTASASRPAAR